jgi:nitrite reductase/ring-hydroxylating ferredoxin subunit
MKTEDYAQGDAFQAEKRTIFSADWLPVCAEAQIPRAGDFLSVTVGGWSLIAVRDQTGAVRVLRNMCRHQSMPVVSTPSGQCEHFRCRFHGWTFDLQGKFLAAPPPVAPAERGPQHDLLSLAVVVEAGIVFFCLEALSPPPSPRLEPALPDYGGTIVTDVAANWKVVVEHLLDGRPPEADGFTWQAPLLALRRAGTKAIVEQIVPHTFLRTRLFTHVFGDDVEGHRQMTSVLKANCETLQGGRAAGAMSAEDNALLSDFHRRIETAYAGSS